MTLRNNSKFRSCRRLKTDIWARIFANKKRVKLRKILKPNKFRLRRFLLRKAHREKQRELRRNRKSFGYKKKYRRIKNLRRFGEKTNFGKNLIAKQKVVKFYGGLKEYQFKHYLMDAKKCKKNILTTTLNRIEKRIDIILTRSNLITSVFQARSQILHSKIVKNNKIVKKMSQSVNKQDIIQILSKRNLLKNIVSKKLWAYPDYAFVNWKTLKLGIHESPSLTKLNYPFSIKQRRILQFYKI